jgi:3-methylornithyl-N6-L-lysine dehydrogenase
MTEGRLRAEDVAGMKENLAAYDAGLILKTSLSLKEIALRSMETGWKKSIKSINSHKIAVIRITSGQGIIENFAEAVKGILVYMGANVYITTESDIAGLAESIENGCDIAFLADDKRFIALNFSLKKVVDNTEATAKGYVFALDAMVKGLKDRDVLVIGGAGRVGWNAVLSLKKKGAQVSVVDPEYERMTPLFKRYGVRVENDLDAALKRYKLVFDASPAKDIIQSKHITPETFIAAPGIPIGLTEEARFAVKERLIHDMLQIGVATMLVLAVTE